MTNGLLTFTVYQRNAHPRFWLCGVVVQREGFMHDTPVDLYRPFGTGSESDVFISQLSVMFSTHRMSSGIDCVVVHAVFDGRHQIDCQLQAQSRHESFSGMNGAWSRTFQGAPDGRAMVLVIEFKSGQILLPYGDRDTQQSSKPS